MAKNSAKSIALQLQQLANEATEKSFQYNSQEATTARNWQKEMSDTSHQREVADLKKAGLNPVLSSGGNGAQSYTTSSASAQASDPTSAVGNVWSSQIGADATRAAAAQSAKAMKYAADQQAAAARYAASMQYESTKYAWDSKAQQLKDEYKYKKDLVLNTPVSNVSSLIDKYLTKAGISDIAINSKTAKGLKSFTSGVLNNPSKLFKDNVKASMNDFNKYLTKSGVKQVNAQLRSLGVTSTKKNRNAFVKALIFGKSSYWNYLINRMPKYSNSAVRSRYTGIQI